MINLNSLMAISESSGGYYGGSLTYEDPAPGISLDEAMDLLPTTLMEMQSEIYADQIRENEALVEAAINGSTAQINYIVESAWDNIKGFFTGLFEKLKQGWKAVTAKIGTFIDKMVMNGTDLWKRYGESPQIKGKSFSGLTFHGYSDLLTSDTSFTDNIESYANYTQADDTISEVSGNTGKGFFDIAVPNASTEDIKNATTKMKDVTGTDRQVGYARTVTGMNDLPDDWQKKIKETLYGTKEDIAYGKGGFTVDSVGNALKDPKNLKRIRHQYDGILRNIDDYQKKVERTIDSLKSDLDKKVEAEKEKITALESYCKAYGSCITDLNAVIGALQRINANYQKDRFNQAKSMLVKLMNYKEKKAENSSVSDMFYDDIDSMSFAI